MSQPAYHFVVSSPRSGSTWLARALNHHPEILATENRLFGMFCELWKNANGGFAPRITVDKFIKGFAQHSFFESMGFDSAVDLANDLQADLHGFLADYQRRRSGKSVIVDKVTPYLGTADKVRSLAEASFPNARFVHLIRDGRDIAVSGVFDWIDRENEDSDRYNLFVNRDATVRLTRFFNDALLERWAGYWLDSTTVFRASQSLEVRYEKMLVDQAATLQSIFEYLLVDHSSEIASTCADAATFEKTTGRSSGQTQPLSKARKGVAGDWKNYFTRQDAARFQELTGSLLQDLDYESDSSWIDECPETLELAADQDPNTNPPGERGH